MVLLSGEAGIGRLVLAEELCAWVAGRGRLWPRRTATRWGRHRRGYAPIVEWLRDAALKSRLKALDDVWLVEVARILPAVLADRHTSRRDPPALDRGMATHAVVSKLWRARCSDRMTMRPCFCSWMTYSGAIRKR